MLESLVEIARRHVDQARGELRQERLEAQALFEQHACRHARDEAAQEEHDQHCLDDDQQRGAEGIPRDRDRQGGRDRTYVGLLSSYGRRVRAGTFNKL